MGCAASRTDIEGRVQNCKERKKLMKQLVRFRGEFAEAQLAYLRAMRNTGGALRQFIEPELLEPESTSYSMPLPTSPPHLPPSPPPLPAFIRHVNGSRKDVTEEDDIEIETHGSSTARSPRLSFLGYSLDLFGPASPYNYQNTEVLETTEDEWADARSEFEEDQEEDDSPEIVSNPTTEKSESIELTSDNASTTSWYTRENADGAVERCRSKTLYAIITKLDDCFLEASTGGKEIAILMEINKEDNSPSNSFKESKRKRYNSAKVFNALSWGWSPKSLQFTKNAAEVCGSSQPCRPGAHCFTLKKLLAAEKGLYKEMKKEEITRFEHERKLAVLQKQEEVEYDWIKTEKTRLIVESLESELSLLRHSISQISSSIRETIEGELYPQLIELISGLMRMWEKMYECHRKRSNISEQLDRITDCQSLNLASEYHREATAQLKTEVILWYNSFSKLMKSQQEYVRTLYKWTTLTRHLLDDQHRSNFSSGVHRLCKRWEGALEILPDKVVFEALKSLLSAVHSITVQQMVEYNMQKRSDKLEKRLQKELHSLTEMEQKLEGNTSAGDTNSSSSLNDSLSVKRAKIEVLKKHVEDEKAKYLNLVEVNRATTLKKLKTTLPNLVQALIRFSSACTRLYQFLANHASSSESSDENPEIPTSSICSDSDTKASVS